MSRMAGRPPQGSAVALMDAVSPASGRGAGGRSSGRHMRRRSWGPAEDALTPEETQQVAPHSFRAGSDLRLTSQT